jgi:hypothetical protein
VIVSVVEQWRKLHPRRTGNEPAFIEVNAETVKAMEDHYAVQKEVVAAVQTLLTDQQLAELEAVCSLGRYGGYPESHEARVERTQKRHEIEGNVSKQIVDLMNKTNFLDALVKALRRLGRPSLAGQVSGM